MHAHSAIPAMLLFIAALVTAGGCSDDRVDQKACPTKGLGVQAATGELCSEILASKPTSAAAQDCLAQFVEYKDYNCVDPQISIDKTKRALFAVANPNTALVTVNWTITNCAGGPRARDLTITGVGVAGDPSCFFSAQPDIEGKTVKANTTISMRIGFKPTAVGEHNAAVYLISDAQNYPKMILPICVKVVDKLPGADGGAADYDCKNVTGTCNESCHPGCSALPK